MRPHNEKRAEMLGVDEGKLCSGETEPAKCDSKSSGGEGNTGRRGI